MSEIPIQTPARGAHEAGEDTYLDDTAYDGSYDSDAAYGSYSAPADAASEDDVSEDEDVTAALTPEAPVTESHVDLDSDPFADDLSKELAAAAPKRWANRATVVIGALALIVGGFLGGVQVEKHYGATATSNAAAARRGAGFTGAGRGEGGFGFGGGTGAGGAAAGGLGAGGTGAGGSTAGGATGTGSTASATTTGTVKLVDGTTLYVQLASSDIVTVKTTTATKVSIGSASGKLSALKVGEKVTVTGKADSTGTVTATAVTATP